MSSMKHGIKIYFDAELEEWLRHEAARRKCSLAQVVRDLIVSEMEWREKLEQSR